MASSQSVVVLGSQGVRPNAAMVPIALALRLVYDGFVCYFVPNWNKVTLPVDHALNAWSTGSDSWSVLALALYILTCERWWPTVPTAAYMLHM